MEYVIFFSALAVILWLMYRHGERLKQQHDYERAMLGNALLNNAQYKMEPVEDNDEWIVKMQREGHERGYMVTVGGKMMPDTPQCGIEQRKNFWELVHGPIDWNKELDELRDKNRNDKPPDRD